MVAQCESSTDTVRTFPEISTITNPEFPSKVRTLTAQFIALKAQSRNGIVTGRGDGCMSSLIKFGRRLVEELQALCIASRYINSGTVSVSTESSAKKMPPDEIVDFLSQDNLPSMAEELVAAFRDAKDSVTNVQIRRSAEFRKGVTANCDLPTTNEFLARAIENLEEVVATLSSAIPDISAETSRAAEEAANIHSVE